MSTPSPDRLLLELTLAPAKPIEAESSASGGFDATKSHIKPEELAEFLQADVNPDLKSVPGIGPITEKELAKSPEPITTTHQLLGKFLSFRGKGATTEMQCEEMRHWLQLKGVHVNRTKIVAAVAAKVASWFPPEA